MRYFQLALLCFLCMANSYGQAARYSYGKIDVTITKESRKKISASVEITSPFPGGDAAWVRSMETYLNQSIRLGKRVKKGKYVIPVQFVIAKDSSLSDVQCLNDPGSGMCRAVVGALLKHRPWRPAPYQGTPVRPYRTSSATPRDRE